MARCIAILEAIDGALDEQGVVDRTGKVRYLLAQRSRVSRELQSWLAKISTAIDRQSSDPVETPSTEQLLDELRRIGMGHDSTATTHDRVIALRELMKREPDPNQRTSVVIKLGSKAAPYPADSDIEEDD